MQKSIALAVLFFSVAVLQASVALLQDGVARLLFGISSVLMVIAAIIFVVLSMIRQSVEQVVAFFGYFTRDGDLSPTRRCAAKPLRMASTAAMPATAAACIVDTDRSIPAVPASSRAANVSTHVRAHRSRRSK